ncbi:MAG: protein kinase domain-containing protein [Myxococcota bacterium]
MEEFVEKRLGQTVGGRWQLNSVLGVGGMAAVYAATEPLGSEAAVKILHPEIGIRPDLRDRFMREGYVANRIQHSGVVRVLEHGAVEDWSAFLVMERLQGESLGERVSREGTLPLPELLDILDQVLDVLAIAHDAGIVHRDLKPDNLFVCERGVIKVLDFGIARVTESAPDDVRTRTGMAMGTLPFMAPEQALGRRAEIDGRVDLFALGATAFRILTKRYIHQADSQAGMLVAIASQPAPPICSVATDVPENVAAVVDLALAFNRDARYPDARTMQTDVRALRRGDAPPFAVARRRTACEATRAALPRVAATAAPKSSSDQQRPLNDIPTAVAGFGLPTVVAAQATVAGAHPGLASTKAAQAVAPSMTAAATAATVVAPAIGSQVMTVAGISPTLDTTRVATPAPAPSAKERSAPDAKARPGRWMIPVAAALLLVVVAAITWQASASNGSAQEHEADEGAAPKVGQSVVPVERTQARQSEEKSREPMNERGKRQEKARELQRKIQERMREAAKKETERRRDAEKR